MLQVPLPDADPVYGAGRRESAPISSHSAGAIIVRARKRDFAIGVPTEDRRSRRLSCRGSVESQLSRKDRYLRAGNKPS